MIRYFVCFMICCTFFANLSGQQVISPKEMVGITPVVPEGLNLPDNAKKSLGQKLLQITTQNGFGSLSGELVLTANVLVTDKQVTSTIPAQFIVNIEVSMYVLNVMEGVIIDETSVSLRGIDKLEGRAVMQALNNLNPRSPAVRKFMNGCRERILDCYTTRMPVLLGKAKSLTERAQYDEALAVLSMIPENIGEYAVVTEQMVGIYKKKIDKDAKSILQDVNAKIANKDYGAALEKLTLIDPASVHFVEASKMIESMKQAIDEKEQKELEEQMQEIERIQKSQQDEVALEKLRIEAAKKIGVAYCEAFAKQTLDSKVSEWFSANSK